MNQSVVSCIFFHVASSPISSTSPALLSCPGVSSFLLFQYVPFSSSQPPSSSLQPPSFRTLSPSLYPRPSDLITSTPQHPITNDIPSKDYSTRTQPALPPYPSDRADILSAADRGPSCMCPSSRRHSEASCRHCCTGGLRRGRRRRRRTSVRGEEVLVRLHRGSERTKRGLRWLSGSWTESLRECV